MVGDFTPRTARDWWKLGYSVGIRVGFALGAGIGLLMIVAMFLSDIARAASPALCEAYAREAVRMAVAGPISPALRSVTRDQIIHLHGRVFGLCLAEDDPQPLRTRDAGGSFADWLAVVERSVSARQGIEPATAEPASAERGNAKDCREAYRSYRESDGTVVRRGSRGKRVPCPL